MSSISSADVGIRASPLRSGSGSSKEFDVLARECALAFCDPELLARECALGFCDPELPSLMDAPWRKQTTNIIEEN